MSKFPRLALHSLFFLWGAAALAYEVLWMRRFSVLLGATAPAAAAAPHDRAGRIRRKDPSNGAPALPDRFDVVVGAKRASRKLPSPRLYAFAALELGTDLVVPWRRGESSLYTRDSFEAVRRALAPGGLYCQWIPLYQISEPEFDSTAASFLDVFPQTTLWRGDFNAGQAVVALLGHTDPRGLDRAIADARSPSQMPQALAAPIERSAREAAAEWRKPWRRRAAGNRTTGRKRHAPASDDAAHFKRRKLHARNLVDECRFVGGRDECVAIAKAVRKVRAEEVSAHTCKRRARVPLGSRCTGVNRPTRRPRRRASCHSSMCSRTADERRATDHPRWYK